MADKINEIISPEAFAQLEKLTADLNESAAAMKQLAEYARGLDFSKAKSLSDLGQWAQDYEKNLNAMSAANQNYANNLQKAIVLKQQLNGSTKSVVDTYDKLEAAELKAAKAAEIRERTAQKAAAETEKAAKREEKALRELNNEYELLKRAYKDAADKAKELGISFGTNSKIFKDAASNAKVMYDRLLKVEMAVGQGQRAVGQYNQAAFAMQQILREGPAFANSFATGIMAISNNLPILADEIKRMKMANDELKASGAATIPVWKTLLGSILSPMGLLSIAITGLTFLATKVDIFSEKTDKAKESADAFAESMKSVGRAGAEAGQKQIQNAEVLTKIVSDENRSQQARTAAFKELQELYPQYLQNLTQEDMLKGKAFDALQAIKKEIDLRTMLQSTEEEGIALRRRESELLSEAYNAETLEDQHKARKALAEIGNEIKRNTKLYEEQRAELLYLPTAPEKSGKKDKAGKAMAYVAPSDEAMKASYDAAIREQEIIRDKNKAIADDEKVSQQDRITAYNTYTAALLQIAKEQKDKEIDIETNLQKEIADRKKTAQGQELQNLYDAEYASNIRVQTINKDFAAQSAAIAKKSKDDILAIVYSSNEQWIKSEEFRNEKLKELQIGLFLQDSELLKRQLQNKEITQKQYNDKMKQLRRTEGVMLLDDDIALYEKILANDQITAEKRLEIQKKLNQAMKAKSQMSEGQPMRKSGRITDSLGMMLGLGNEDELQAFYDNAVNLANTAADAIIEANQRQYAAQQAMLDDQLQKVRNNYDMQLNLIEVTKMSEEERANKVAKLNSQRAEQEAAIEEKKKQASIRQAKFEKAATVASIIGNTAAAIMKVVKQLGVASPPLVALVAATGAVQLASALAAPIPAYKEGTDNHIGGAFIAGDGGEPELIVAPNKRPYWSNSVSTLYNEGAGTKVIPMSDIMQYTTTNTEDFSAAQLDALANRIAKSFDKTGYKIAQVMQATKPQINMDAIAQQMRRERNLQGK